MKKIFSKENLCFIIRIYGVQITLDDVNFTEQCFHKRAAEEKREGWSTFLRTSSGVVLQLMLLLFTLMSINLILLNL